jgi:PAS domain S-box-containing protein
MSYSPMGPHKDHRMVDRRKRGNWRGWPEPLAGEPSDVQAWSGDTRALVQELQVHQIELETQNEELRATHLDLERSREDYFDLYDLAPVGYLTLSERSLILELNLTAAALVGAVRDKLLRSPFTQLIHPEDQSLYYKKRKLLFEQGAPQIFELRLLTASGAVVWANVQTTLARDRAGEPVLRATLGNITERKKTEAALFHAQKLESLGVLAGGIAHDFNNLLTTMLGNIELCALDDSEGSQERHLGVARECVLRAAGLCRQLLTYAGGGRFHRTPVRLSDLVQSYLGFMKISLPKGVVIRLDLEPGLPEIEADAGQIEQALMNLVTNAAESCGPQGGTLQIRTRLRTFTPADQSAAVPGMPLEPGPCVVVEVEDTGAGMDPATLKKIFDPFFTTKFVGRGLGLAALQGIMQVNLGAVQVCSRPGQGTCFSLWFPVAPPVQPVEELPAAPMPRPEAPRPEAAIQGEGTVLVVDDEEQVRMVLTLFLRRQGFEVLEARDGEEGLAAYRQCGDRIRLVLMDVTMPRMGGAEAARKILEDFPQARIIFMSGYVQDSLEGLPDTGPMGGFLRKPFLHSEVVALVAHSLAQADP